MAGPGNPPYEVHAVVDDDGTGMGASNECVEDNNDSPPIVSCMIQG